MDGKHDAVISCGGGKAMDTGRAAAAGFAILMTASGPEIMNPLGANVACVQAPTVAASDAATASVSVLYSKEGVQEGAFLMRTNPAMVLVDTRIIVQAPVRTLVAGMGDALATRFEAEVSNKTGTAAITGGLSSQTALMMSQLSFDILMEKGREAKQEAETGVPGPAFEAVVEANILLSGVGYESGGLSAAHAIAGSLTILHDQYDPVPYHGEMVAFSTLCQLIMENRNPKFLDDIFGFCKDVGLPTTLEALGLKESTEEALEKVADVASKSMIIQSMPGAYENPDAEGRFYDPEDIFRCIKEADARGQS